MQMLTFSQVIEFYNVESLGYYTLIEQIANRVICQRVIHKYLTRNQ